METRPLIILGSARKHSDTKAYLEKVFSGLEYTETDLLDYKIYPYAYSGLYPADDEFPKITVQLLAHRIIVFATPVYWYAMSGLMKTFFDRLTDLVTTQKAIGRQLKGKTIFLLAVGADEELPNGFEMPFKLTAQYLDMQYGSSLYFSTKIEKHYQDAKDCFLVSLRKF